MLSVLINKISASELSRKFLKSALLVGKEVENKNVALHMHIIRNSGSVSLNKSMYDHYI